MTTKYCAKCKSTKDTSEFYQRKKYRWECERYQSYCKACTRQRSKLHYQANAEKYRAKERARKLALGEAHLIQKRAQRAKVRTEVVHAYGGKCACCGVTEPAFLAIDHIDGGGKKHLKDIGGPSNLIYWLKKNGYPQGFQVLCHNCNMAKSIYKICPHQHETGATSL